MCLTDTTNSFRKRRLKPRLYAEAWPSYQASSPSAQRINGVWRYKHL